MRKIKITDRILTENTELLDISGNDVSLKLSSKGAGIDLSEISRSSERYLVFDLLIQEQHSMSMNLHIFSKNKDEKEPVFTVRFGILGNIKTPFCIDLDWMNAQTLFPDKQPGELKIVCHGRRVEREEIGKVILCSLPCFHDITIQISNLKLTDEFPAHFPLPDIKLIDEFGQNKRKEWTGKIHNAEELQKVLQQQLNQKDKGYPFKNWTIYGGYKDKKLTDGSGYFSKIKENGKWWLVDPLGYAFFSMGPDCVGVASDCRVDGIEKWMDWLPDENDPVYEGMYRHHKGWSKKEQPAKLFSFSKANLCRVFGADWYDQWKCMITGQLRKYGLNTLGNWSDQELLGNTGMPYVTSLPKFPATSLSIFRDFPDVFSREYAENAKECAKGLRARKDDPYMIGYFLRNEPAWAFVDNLVLADEVLFNPERSVCKERLIETLMTKYKDIQNLNKAWNVDFASFEDLYTPQKKVSARSEASCRDMKEFSRRMLKAYIEIPSRACREADPNHMILGMRWAWISDPDLVTGWENFDVFSINCYAVDPTNAIQNIVNLGVDLPVVIGEFHYGALDAGLTATGLEGVMSQKDRGIAYRYYCERVAAHPHGAGCHYFQCYDQFLLGRFDGENYNIGLFDICSQPYTEMVEEIKVCSSNIYKIAEGKIEPSKMTAQSIPMIAY